MKVQILGTMTEKDGTRWYSGITGTGNVVEFTLLDDADPLFLVDIKRAVKHRHVIEVDVNDIRQFRRLVKRGPT
jgi:hypothetical protein